MICRGWDYCNRSNSFNIIINNNDIVQKECLNFGIDKVIFEENIHNFTYLNRNIQSTCKIKYVTCLHRP